MADAKVTSLTASTTPISTDISYVVVDPGGTPLSRKVTLGNIIQKAHGLTDGLVAVSSSALVTTSTTGTGNVVRATNPTLVDPALGTPTSGTLTNCTGLPVSTGISGLGTGIATFLATPSSANLASAVTNETGSGALVFANNPTLVDPALGTPTSGTLTNCTGLPLSTGITGILPVVNGGTGVTASTGTVAVVLSTSPTLVTPNIGAATYTTLTGGNITLNGSVLFRGATSGTTTLAVAGSAGTITLTLPVTAGSNGDFLRTDGSGNLSFAAVPGGGDALTSNPLSQFAATTSLELKGVISDETGSGALVFATNPTLSSPALGTPTSGTLTNCTGLPLTTGITGILPVANGGTGVTTSTGTIAVVLSNSPTLVTPILGAASYTTLSGGSITIGPTGSTLTLGENTSIALDPAGSADGRYSGITVTGTGGATIAFGDLVTLDKDDSRWELVDISVAAAATGDARGIIGIAVTSSTDGGALTVLLNGIIRADAAFPVLTIGAPVYASTTGDVVVTQPSTTDHVIRIVGFGLTADEMYFNPSNDYITRT